MSGLPTEAFDLTEFKRSRMVDINAKTEAIFASGFVYTGVGAPPGGIAVKGNTRSLLFYMSLADLGGALALTMLPAADDLSPPLEVGLLNIGAFTGAWKQWLRNMYQAEYLLKQAIRSATTREAVEAVVDMR